MILRGSFVISTTIRSAIIPVLRIIRHSNMTKENEDKLTTEMISKYVLDHAEGNG